MDVGRITVAQAQDIVGVARNTIIAMLRDGRVTGTDHGPGTSPRYELDRASVEAFRDAGPNRLPGQRRVTRPFEHHRADIDLAAEGPGGRDEAGWRDVATTDDLGEMRSLIADLRAENDRLRVIARNANVAVQAQTESLQQFLISDRPESC